VASFCPSKKVESFAMANSRARKGELGFQGFVQSDWWAVHEPSFVQGLDQEMPGQATELFLSPSNTSQHPQRVDEAATRILAAMYKVNLHETRMVAGHVF
jgi:beta-glucosidase